MNAWISTENGINLGFFNGKKKSGIPDFLEDLRKAGDGITEFFELDIVNENEIRTRGR